MFNLFGQPIAKSVAWDAASRLKAALLFLALLFAGSMSYAADDFLDPEVAFKFSARMLDAKTAQVTYTIADGYYMYREHFKFRVEGAKLGTPVYPAGIVHFDETFQKNVETYHHSVSVRLPVETSGPFTLIATGQGCAEKGLCYPPQESRIKLTPPASVGLQGPANNAQSGSGNGWLGSTDRGAGRGTKSPYRDGGAFRCRNRRRAANQYRRNAGPAGGVRPAGSDYTDAV